jgi:hypothetical protein
LLVGDFYPSRPPGNYVDQDIATEQRHELGAFLGAPKKFKSDGINGEEVSTNSRNPVFVRVYSAGEVSVRLFLEVAPMDDMDLFICGRELHSSWGFPDLTCALKHVASVVAIVSPARRGILGHDFGAMRVSHFACR